MWRLYPPPPYTLLYRECIRSIKEFVDQHSSSEHTHVLNRQPVSFFSIGFASLDILTKSIQIGQSRGSILM